MFLFPNTHSGLLQLTLNNFLLIRTKEDYVVSDFIPNHNFLEHELINKKLGQSKIYRSVFDSLTDKLRVRFYRFNSYD